MNNAKHPSRKWDFDRWLLNQVRFGWQWLFNMEKVLMRKIFIKEFQPRKDDVCVVTYMRSGTTKLQMLLYQLLTDGNMDFHHFSDVSPLLEEAMMSGKGMEHLPSPRVFKTHGDYKYFPRKSKARIIYVVRNGMDVASSVYHYYKGYNMPNLKWDGYLNWNFMNRISWFKHVADWMENKYRFNICYVKYEDMNNNPREVAVKLAAFLDVKVDAEILDRVAERCSFSYMKDHQGKFSRPQVQPNKVDVEFIRKGESNKGQLEFNEEQRKKFCDLYDKYLGKYNLGYDFSRKVAAPAKPADQLIG